MTPTPEAPQGPTTSAASMTPAEAKVLVERMEGRERCPECGDARGWWVRPTMPDGEPEQVQCQICDEYRALTAALRSLADQLEAMPVCAMCGGPVACLGAYDGSEWAYACDECCGHGNEDGHCVTLAEIPALVARSIQDTIRATERADDAADAHAAQLAQVRAEAVNCAAEAVREFREQVLEMCAASSRLATKVNDMGGYRVARSLYLDISVLASMPQRGEAGEEAR